ncbi:hypothetical protein IWW37_000466 [Coemansia sp. RSA 2050]|nr:hypothetical protein IWW37_000466 [Coemansia sp. RSA 2050]
MPEHYSFTQEESRQLAEAYTAMADVFELIGARAGLAEAAHGLAAQERVLEPMSMPKAPLSARDLYYRDHIEAMAARSPGLSYGDIKKFVAAGWKALSKKERAPYKSRYKALKRQFKIDVAAYDARAKAHEQTDHGGPVSAACHSERSALSMSPSPPAQSPQPAPTARFTEPDLSASTLVSRSSSQPMECLNEGVMPYSVEDIVRRKLGPGPGRPLRPYELFCQSVRGAIKEEFPGLITSEADRIGCARWRALSMEERQPFNDRHTALMKQYKIDVAAYNARMGAFLSINSEPVLAHSDEELERVLGPRPQHVRGTMDFYCRENTRRRLRENPGLSVTGARRGLATMWKRASKEERQPYHDRFQALAKQYYDRAQALLISAYGMPDSPNSSNVLEHLLGCKPCQPVSAFVQYYDNSKLDVAKNNPGLGYNDVRKIASAQWKAASKEVRQEYKGRYHLSVKQYKIDIAAYDARERALLKAAIRKLRQPCESSVADTTQFAQGPITDVPPSSVPPLPSQCPLPPMSTTGLLPWLSAPSLPTSSVPLGFAGPLPLLPVPIKSTGSLLPVGSPAPSLPTLPSGAASSDVATPAHPPAITWPAELTLPGECLASLSLSGNSGGLPRPFALAEDTLSSIPATVPELVEMAVSNATMALAETVGSPETIATAMPQEQPLSSNPPTPDVTSPAFSLPVESVEPQTLFKSKKKRKHSADGDTQEPGASDRKKKKKRVSNFIVKIESGTGEATTDEEDYQTDNTDVVVKHEL